jgi:DNA repair exonuclease SbcCD ATPase subunit
MSSLKEKAKTLNELLWKNRLEWDKWLRLGVTEQKQIELAPKYQEKWVKLEDAQKEIERIHREYEGLISKAEKDCADCYQELKQKLRQLLNEFPDINNEKYKLPDAWVVQDIIDTNVLFIKDVFRWKKKFEELLKDGNE